MLKNPCINSPRCAQAPKCLTPQLPRSWCNYTHVHSIPHLTILIALNVEEHAVNAPIFAVRQAPSYTGRKFMQLFVLYIHPVGINSSVYASSACLVILMNPAIHFKTDHRTC